MVRQLTSHAAGRMALLFQSSPLYAADCVIDSCVRFLLGDNIPWSTGKHPLTDNTSDEVLRKVIQVQRPFWTSLQFEVRLPDANVLIPPWMNDEKVIKFNPELHKIFH